MPPNNCMHVKRQVSFPRQDLTTGPLPQSFLRFLKKNVKKILRDDATLLTLLQGGGGFQKNANFG